MFFQSERFNSNLCFWGGPSNNIFSDVGRRPNTNNSEGQDIFGISLEIQVELGFKTLSPLCRFVCYSHEKNEGIREDENHLMEEKRRKKQDEKKKKDAAQKRVATAASVILSYLNVSARCAHIFIWQRQALMAFCVFTF